MEQIKKNITKKFILKTILYIVFLWFVFPILILIPVLPLMIKYFNLWSEESLLTDFIGKLITFYVPFVFSPFACYITAKLFGIFKFIDNLKTGMLKKLFVLILISTLSFLVLVIELKYEEGYACYKMPVYIFSLIPAFFLYKYFQYLTKKYPIPFEKIGYYCSIEFWKKTVLKLYKKINGIN